ncbi:radical SAM protein [Candidatus Pacearchaeota archaeon]|nr:radical SAM protein [Candidatus Pacearchaeota archaeon]
MGRAKTLEEHQYTSTGVKFWRHPEQMNSYRQGGGGTVVATHVSPTSRCNLECSYCSVKKRDRQSEIEFQVMQKYISDLKSRGLRSVIFTGGGEPTIYDRFNDLALWTKDQGLDTALITNGTLIDRVSPEAWRTFSWARVSINQFPGWQDRINLPRDLVDESCTLGASFVYTGQSLKELREVESVAKRFDADYIRVLPDCLHSQGELLRIHDEIDQRLESLGDTVFFHQFKIHGVPNSDTCHQSFFRPYLSEVGGGTVYPCDSVVLNSNSEHFAEKYKICGAEEILNFLDGEIKSSFSPSEDCEGCVFTENVDMLGAWKEKGEMPPEGFKKDKLRHENFP